MAEADLPLALTPGRIRALCSRSTGVGSDGVMLVSRPVDPEHVARVRVYNPDGSEDELSGNGSAQVASYLVRTLGHRAPLALETGAGVVLAHQGDDGAWRIRLARASLESKDYPAGPRDGTGVLAVGEDRLAFRHVFVGNPQCAVEVDQPLDCVPVELYGSAIESHPLFPERTNVSFWRAESRHEISVRVYERGVGETLSSGTGACGAAVAASLNGVRSPVTVRLPGGPIEVDVGADLSVSLTSRPQRLFTGVISGELARRLTELPGGASSSRSPREAPATGGSSPPRP